MIIIYLGGVFLFIISLNNPILLVGENERERAKLHRLIVNHFIEWKFGSTTRSKVIFDHRLLINKEE